MKPSPSVKTWGLEVSTYSVAFLEGGTFISALRLRIARMAFMTDSIWASSVLKFNASLASGHLATIRALSRSGRLCQISSVMKGMKGCSSRSV